MEVDRISYLPQDIIHKIFSFMSLRDVVRTSVLSTNWRHKWTYLKDLNFNDQIMVVVYKDPKQALAQVIKIVDHVLLLHSGFIHKFEITHNKLRACDDIVRWISFLSTKSVKEFVLFIKAGGRFVIPPSLYGWKDLTQLELINCVMKPPSIFNNFPSLKLLDLEEVTMDQVGFETLISHSPLLEKLNLTHVDGVFHLNVDSPTLSSIDFCGAFEDFDFKNTSKVSDMCIFLEEIIGSVESRMIDGGGGLIKFFASLPNLERLDLLRFSLKFLAVGKVPNRLPTTCIKLGYLSLDVNVYDAAECLAVLCILRSSPNLQLLEIQGRASEQDAAAGEVPNDTDCLLTRLRRVEVVGLPMLPSVMTICSFLLENSPVLEKMTIKPASPVTSRDLFRVHRASPHAEIIYVDA